MLRGISIHVGVNQLDPGHYGYKGKLYGCENDARAMQSIAETCGYESILLLTRQATTVNVLRELSRASEQLESGDILLLTYAGHGSQIPDASGDENDQIDETWCLYDRMLIDDELVRLWGRFNPGVRIFMVSDSCHSGTMARRYEEDQAAVRSLLVSYNPRFERSAENEVPVFRALPQDIAMKVYNANRNQYDMIQSSNTRSEGTNIGASVLLISACQDNQTAADGRTNGLFTSTLLEVWAEGKFSGNYYSFYKEIADNMPPIQSPKYYTVGSANPDFERERPFAISTRPNTSDSNANTSKPVCSCEKGEDIDMELKKQQEINAIADEIVLLAKGLKSVATAGTARELEMGSLDSGCERFQCVSKAVV